MGGDALYKEGMVFGSFIQPILIQCVIHYRVSLEAEEEEEEEEEEEKGNRAVAIKKKEKESLPIYTLFFLSPSLLSSSLCFFS